MAGCSSRAPATSPPTVTSKSAPPAPAVTTGRAAARHHPAHSATDAATTHSPHAHYGEGTPATAGARADPSHGIAIVSRRGSLAASHRSQTPRGYAIYTTELRPGPGYPPAGVAWIDSAATRLALYAGTSEPYGTWPQQGAIAVPQRASLLAGFNSGFKIYSYATGWYDQGRTAVPLRAGAASFVIFTNGTATVADWGRDVESGPTVSAVRQNLTLLVDHGVAAPTVATPSQWGAVLGGGSSTWRSGVGVTAAGNLVYAGGPDLDPAGLARLLIAADAIRAMELDINPEWVSFATFTHAGGITGTGIIGASNLLAGMYFTPGHYLQPYSRDFFAVSAR